MFEQLHSSAQEAHLTIKWHVQTLNYYYYLQFQSISEDSFVPFTLTSAGHMCFGAVNGCKTGTTCKLYAMNVSACC